MSNTKTNHEAAGVAATTARGDVKKEWYEKPFLLNTTIAIAAILIAVSINANFQFNPFWKILLGIALIWGGGSLATTKLSLWGNILSWVGWLVIFMAFVNSGTRHFVEGTMNKIDAVLGSVWSESASAAGSSTVARGSGEMKDGVSLNGPGSPQRATINRKGTITVAFQVPVNQPGWLICQRLVEPTVLRSHGGLPRYVLKDVFKGSGVVTYALNDQTTAFVMKEEVTAPLTFEFELKQATTADPSPCPR